MTEYGETEWFIELEDENAEGNSTRRVAEVDGYRVEEEKIGSTLDPDYTHLRAFSDGELECAVVYEGDGSGLQVAEIDGERMEETGEEYRTPVRLLNGDGSGIEDLVDDRLENTTSTASSVYARR